MKSFLVSATIAAILGLLASRFFTPPPDKVEKVVETTPEPPKPVAPIIAAAPLTEAQTSRTAPETVAKRQNILSLIAAAGTEAEIKGLLRDFAGDAAAEESLISHWTQLDPQACLKWIRDQRYEVNDPKFHMLRSLFRTWASSDPASAWEAVTRDRARPGFNDAVFEVIETAMQRSVADGAKFLAQLPDFPTMYFFPKNLWLTDPASLVTACVPEGRTPDKSLVNALQEPLTAWSTKDPAAVLAWLESLPPASAQPLLAYAMAGLGKHNPEAAANLISQIPSTAVRENAAEALVRSWTQKDPAAALQYAVSQLGPHRKAALTEITRDLAHQGTPAIQATLTDITNAESRRVLLPILAGAWLDEDPTLASQWLSTLPSGPERTDALSALANRWANNDSLSALSFLSKDPDPTLSDLYQKSIFRAINLNPTEAMPLILSQPADRVLPGIQAAYNVMSTEYQVEDATALLNTLPKPEYQIAAVRSFMEPFATGMRVFDAGLEWAASLPPGPLRDTARDTLLKSTQLTPKERAKVTKAFQ